MSLLSDCGMDLAVANAKIEQLHATLAKREDQTEAVGFAEMMERRATGAMAAARKELDRVTIERDQLRELVSQALVKATSCGSGQCLHGLPAAPVVHDGTTAPYAGQPREVRVDDDRVQPTTTC